MPNLNIKCTVNTFARAAITDKQALHIVLNMEELEREAIAEATERIKDGARLGDVEVVDMEVYFD